MLRFASFTLLCLLLLASCSSTQRTVFEGQPKSEAEAAYREAVGILESGSYEDAIRKFSDLKLKYPYATRWSTMSDLRIADAHRESGEYSVAAVSYQDFVRTYPTHSEVPYAMFQAANCYYEQMPSNLFFLPDPWQRERKSTKQAETAYKVFLNRHPDDKNAEEAQKKLDEVQRRLANYELYVAEYNFKHKSYEGTILRTQSIEKLYPQSSLVPRALTLQAHAFLKLKDPIRAKRDLQRVASDYKDSDYAKEARAWLARNSQVPDFEE
ncbi:MAG: outer membrane protein assembly factor BamD [Bradymonadales bacterium]|jgi:outer membrane protein assembly factor BamD